MNDDYLQPDFYRFNQDSIELVKWIRTRVASSSAIADLGAGCGVMGLELARAFDPQRLELVELQDAFVPYLKANVAKFLPSTVRFRIEMVSYAKWKPDQTFDLLVANPPYYLPQSGEASKRLERQLCRSFIEDNWFQLIKAMELGLSPEGRGYLVVKDQPDIVLAMQAALKDSGLQTVKEKIKTVVLVELRR